MLEVKLKTCRQRRTKPMHIRAEQHSSLTFEKQENIVRQETFHGKMQRTAIDKA